VRLPCLHLYRCPAHPPGFPLRPGTGDPTVVPGGLTACHSEAGGATAGPSGPTVPPPPPGPTAAGGLTTSLSSQIAHEIKVSSLTAWPFAASSSCASSTSTVPLAAPTTPPTPSAAPASKHYSRCPRGALEPLELPLL
jgi:hypothetical protein